MQLSGSIAIPSLEVLERTCEFANVTGSVLSAELGTQLAQKVPGGAKIPIACITSLHIAGR